MDYARIVLFVFFGACYTYQVLLIVLDYQKYPTTIDLSTKGHGTLKYPGVTTCITNWVDRTKFETRFPDVNLEGPGWKEEVVETLRKEGNLAEVAISAETHFQFGVSNPTFYFVEFYLKKTSIAISYSSLPKYMCFSLNWTSEASMQVVHQNPLIFKSSLLFFWVPENVLELDPYYMTIAFHDVDGSSAGERPGIILEPSGEYVFNIEQREIVYLPEPYDTDCTDYMAWPRHQELKSILTKPMCEHDCKNEILLEECGCLSEDYPARHLINTSACLTNKECQREHADAIEKSCAKRCGKACHNIIYDAKQAHSKIFDPLEEGEYYIKLVLLMTSRNVDVMEFIPALSFTKVLGLVGGYLGLWLGLSLVTIINRSLLYGAKIVVKRLRDDYYNILAASCIHRALRFLCKCVCLYACGLSIFVDTVSYLKYRTSVRVDRGNLSNLEFPALTVCNVQAINFSRVCWEYDGAECKTNDPEAILGNRLTLVKELIKFSYPISELVLGCQLNYMDYVCEPADCLNFWKVQYTFLKTGVCYTFDPTLLKEYRDCKEPWRYELSVRLAATSSKEITLSGFLHQQNTFTSAMPNTFMLRPGKVYMVTAEQRTFSALPRPYETQCADYVKMAQRMNYTEGEFIQAEECSERCLSSKWEETCNCYPKLYGARDRLNGSLCEYLSHLRCIQEMKDHSWLPWCQHACTRACHEVRYSTLSFTIGTVQSYLKTENSEAIVNVRMGSFVAKSTSNVARISGSDMFTLISGHVSMWLGISATMLYSLLKYVPRNEFVDQTNKEFGNNVE